MLWHVEILKLALGHHLNEHGIDQYNWHCATILHAILAVWMWRKPDGRPKFSAWVVTRFLFDATQILADRSGFRTESTTIYYFGVVVWALLLPAVLHEAQGMWHRRILFTWAGLYMGTAWIRFFPYTGAAVVIIDAAAYVSWLAEKALFRRHKDQHLFG